MGSPSVTGEMLVRQKNRAVLLTQEGLEAPASLCLWQVFQLLEEPYNTKEFARAVGQAHSIFKNEIYIPEMSEEVQ